MKRLLFAVFCALFCVSPISCNAQNAEKVTEILGNIYQKINHYGDKEISYHLNIQMAGCAYQVLVNDFPIDDGNGWDAGSSGVSAPANAAILKSGTQTWEVRLYPPQPNGVQQTELPKDVRVEVSLETLRFGEKFEKLAKPIPLIMTPKKIVDGDSVFAGAGLPYVSYKGTFEAKVPYELTGWSKSKDLTQIDKDKLERMVRTAYKSFLDYIKHGDAEMFAKLTYKRIFEIAQAQYYTKEENEYIVDGLIKGLTREGLKPEFVEKSIMKIYGNGHVVTMESIDERFVSALVSEFPMGNGINTYAYSLYFIIPEGSDQLEVVR